MKNSNDLDDAIGMLYAVMVNMQGMDFVLAPVVEKLKAYKNNNKVVESGSSIDGTSERVS